MKKSEIVVGGIYNNGMGDKRHQARQVIAEGPEYVLYSGQEDTDCIRYRIVTHVRLDQEGNMTRARFAAWAKRRVDSDQD